jgi:hypothetical protein
MILERELNCAYDPPHRVTQLTEPPHKTVIGGDCLKHAMAGIEERLATQGLTLRIPDFHSQV